MARLALIEGTRDWPLAPPPHAALAETPAAAQAALPEANLTAQPLPTAPTADAEPAVSGTLSAMLAGGEARPPGAAAQPTAGLAGQAQAQAATAADTAASLPASAEAGPRGGAGYRAPEVLTTSAALQARELPQPVAAPEAARPLAGAEPLVPGLGAQAPGPASAAPAQATLPAPIQSPAWPGQLNQQLVQFARMGGEQRVEMQLNPAELGPLSVTLKMTEQGAQAQFLSAHAQVRQVLEQAIPQLREALAEQGITLAESSVGEQRQPQGQAFAENQAGRPGAAAGDAAEDGTGGSEQAAADGAPIGISLDGRVNLYA